MDDKLKTTIDKVVKLTEQNKEFNTELRKRLEISSANSVSISDEKIEDIYEFCIEKVNYQQAIDLYKDFPISGSKDYLVLDYMRMEHFRRKNMFGDFCLAMYQQIENITNQICADSSFQDIVKKLWKQKCYVKTYDSNTKKFITPTLEERDGGTHNTSIAEFIFFGKDSNGHNNSEIKPQIPLEKLSAYEKMRIVLYFVGFGTVLRSRDKEEFDEIISLLYDLYQCRNTNHRGLIQNGKNADAIVHINNLRSLYFSKFHGLLSQFIEFIKKGYPLNEKLAYFAENVIQ